MKLAEILDLKGRQVVTATPEETLQDAIRRLNTHKIGALAVVDRVGKLVGIISERDILRLAAENPCNFAQERLQNHMTRDLITAEGSASVDDALAVMSDNRIRHLPVLKDGRLDGMISQGDLVRAKLNDAQHETRQLTYFVMGKYPA